MIDKIKAIVLDFDGTMCFLFQHYDLLATKLEIKDVLQDYGITFSLEQDAFDAFEEIRKQVDLKQDIELIYEKVHKILSKAELEAVQSAGLVEGIREVLGDLLVKGRKIGIATNNSVEAVEFFLERYFPCSNIPIVGRIGRHPERLKPHPWSLYEISKMLEVQVEEILFVGDTPRDYETANHANCKFYGMVPTERKRKRLLQVLEEEHMASDYNQWIERCKLL